MHTPLRVLIIDDSPLDAELILRELRKGGFDPEFTRVDSAQAMVEALESRAWDVVISDFVMPRFNGLDAIRVMREKEIDLPIIIASGKAGEEVAVETMRAGASDYLIKDNLARLVPAIRRELKDARVRRERRNAEERERRSRKLTEAMASASLRFLETGSINLMAQVLVDSCVSLTNSSFGFLYDILPNGDARVLAVSTSPSTTVMPSEPHDNGLAIVPQYECLLFGPVLEGNTILTNEPQKLYHLLCTNLCARDSIGSFLGTPLKVGGKVVGMIGLVNRLEGFTELEQRELEAFAQTAALAIHSARSELEHKQAMEQLRQAQKMEAIGQLAGGIAHDFNNLLTIINGYSTLLIHEMHKDDPCRSEVEHILQAGERAADLTHQLLAFSRRQILEPKVININVLVKNVEKMLHRLIRENISLKTRLSEEIGMVKADPGQVEQIVMNLIVNARDALEHGGEIIVETANANLNETFVRENRGAIAGRYVMLAVNDNGIGMSEEVKLKIFEPFFTTKAQGRGTGLGLATVYGIVKQSGGYIQVISEIDSGTSFRVYLPRVDTAEEAAILQARREPPRGFETILVVEDEEGVLNLTVRTLTAKGYDVLRATSPAKALELFDNGNAKIDLLLTDVIMPGKNGPQLADELKRLRPDLKIMFMSGYTDDTIAPEEIVESGIAFIMKPFNPGTLTEKVREVLGNRNSA